MDRRLAAARCVEPDKGRESEGSSRNCCTDVRHVPRSPNIPRLRKSRVVSSKQVGKSRR